MHVLCNVELWNDYGTQKFVANRLNSIHEEHCFWKEKCLVENWNLEDPRTLLQHSRPCDVQ